MTFQGHVEKGVVVFDEPVTLPDGAKVRIEPVDESASSSGEQASPGTMFDHLEAVIGSCPDLPPDASVDLDHYLYGHPKRQ